MTLEKSLAVRALLAKGNPPDGWPRVFASVGGGNLSEGEPVPKCDILNCPEPAVFFVSLQSLVSFTGSSRCACRAHLGVIAETAVSWVAT